MTDALMAVKKAASMDVKKAAWKAAWKVERKVASKAEM
jgi:hypothetical protein